MTRAAFADWESGAISGRQALHALLTDLGEVEDEIARLDAERAALRDQIAQIVAREGEMTVGDRRALITAPTVVTSYDRAALDDLVARLAATHPDVAQQIAACRRERMRAGGLRIDRGRPARAPRGGDDRA
jgi:predicted exporter